MFQVTATILLLSLSLVHCVDTDENDFQNYIMQRDKIITEEQSMTFGARISLNEMEQRANDILMRHKSAELRKALDFPATFLPSRNFVRVSAEIESSPVYQLIRRMPKGGVLHAHLSAMPSCDYVLGNITRRPDLYVCRASSGELRLRFFSPAAALRASRAECGWRLLAGARLDDPNLDRDIARAMTMGPDSQDSDQAWRSFSSIFRLVKDLVTYRPVHEDFLYHVMEELYDDNVQFIEIRTPFSTLYELNGHRHKHLQVMEICKNVVERFRRDHPDFLGVKWIYSVQRNVPKSIFNEYVQTFRQLKKAYDNLIVGFDLVGQEDKGRPLRDFTKELVDFGKETQFFFHAGETNWSGQQIDENLLDAVLLNTKRIGHGYALIKHPKLLEIVKEKQIAIEISPISNQVLKLVKDMRNHPAGYFFAQDFPLIVSNDDPGFWGALALSFDFYEAFVGIMSSKADLRALKQLALNSILYSSLNESEKETASDIWRRKWHRFINRIVNEDFERRNFLVGINQIQR